MFHILWRIWYGISKSCKKNIYIFITFFGRFLKICKCVFPNAFHMATSVYYVDLLIVGAEKILMWNLQILPSIVHGHLDIRKIWMFFRSLGYLANQPKVLSNLIKARDIGHHSLISQRLYSVTETSFYRESVDNTSIDI